MAKKPKPKAKAVKVKKPARAAKKPVSKAKPSKRQAKKTISKAKPKSSPSPGKHTKPVMAKVLTGKTNLLVTYDPNHRGIAEAEIKEAFSRIGERYELYKTEVDGLFKLKTEDARRVVRKLMDNLRREKQMLTTTHKYIPIDGWCKSEVSEMQRAVKALVPNIGQGERWKMTLNKRHWDKLHASELILKLTDMIDRPKVDLQKPEKIVQVEIIGQEAGVALLRPDELLDVALFKEAYR